MGSLKRTAPSPSSPGELRAAPPELPACRDGVHVRLGRRNHIHRKGRRPTDSGPHLSGTGGGRGR